MIYLDLNPFLLYELHWDKEMPLATMAKYLHVSRGIITRAMNFYEIQHRNISQDNMRRYKHMTDEEIKAQTSAANNKMRADTKKGDWHLQGKNHHNYKHGLSNTQSYRNSVGAKYRARKLNQTPDNANIKKIQLYYTICSYLNENAIHYHVDHIKPLSKGGLHHQDNLQILDAELNLQKSDTWPLSRAEKTMYKGIII